MSKNYEQIPGSENMSDADKSYFEKFGDAIDDQGKLIAEQYKIDAEEMEKDYAELLNDLVRNDNEYLVNGAPLKCSMQFDDKQRLTYEGKDVMSELIKENIEDMRKLNVTDKRRAKINGFTPATVIDSKGGMRDEKEKWNIGGFGNCGRVQDGTAIEDLADSLMVRLYIKGRHPNMLALREKVKMAIEEGKGTCYCCMNLNPEWENLPTEYNFETGAFEYTLQDVLNETCVGSGYYLSGEKGYKNISGKEGINMMSMIFCKKGGIISAEESGQNVISIDERYIRLLNRIEERTGRLEEYKLEFVKSIFPLLLVEEEKSGIPLEVMFAQMCCESKYGSKAEGNNYFGLKGEGTAGSVIVKTQEEVDGVYVSIDDKFRAYNSMEESIEDYVNVLTNVYQQYTTTGTIEDWFDALVEGGYATNSNYKGELTEVCIFWRLIIE